MNKSAKIYKTCLLQGLLDMNKDIVTVNKAVIAYYKALEVLEDDFDNDLVEAQAGLIVATMAVKERYEYLVHQNAQFAQSYVNSQEEVEVELSEKETLTTTAPKGTTIDKLPN